MKSTIFVFVLISLLAFSHCTRLRRHSHAETKTNCKGCPELKKEVKEEILSEIKTNGVTIGNWIIHPETTYLVIRDQSASKDSRYAFPAGKYKDIA